MCYQKIFKNEFRAYPQVTWLRNPHLSSHDPFSGNGYIIYVKMGRLPTAPGMSQELD
ncbi:MAG: hypothetical protein HC796_08940 [Synechococcaceae cyanobacterium RL_1_2]|nr:hypothetical protein [Synechococcaceae cyanobacterium RL_1_2]